MASQQKNQEITIQLYKNNGWKSLFAKIRFWDAPYFQAESLIPKKGVVVELGCGEGLFSNFLAVCSKDRQILGFELDMKRVKIADRGLNNTFFKCADVTRINIPKANTIVMMHLLHHLVSKKDQVDLLTKSYKALPKGGKLIIVEVEPKKSLKYLVTWCTDHFLVPWLFEGRLYSPIYFRKAKEWKKLLEIHGFSCTIIDAEKNKPFTHIILECQKK